MANPILQLIQPRVSGIPDAAWFVQYASGYVQWAQNPTVSLCTRHGIPVEVVDMGADQYTRYLSMATAGWNPALGGIPGVGAASAATLMTAPDAEFADANKALLAQR